MYFRKKGDAVDVLNDDKDLDDVDHASKIGEISW